MKKLFLIPLFMIIACFNPEREKRKEEEMLQKKIFSIHDILMAQMGTMENLEEKLKDTNKKITDTIMLSKSTKVYHYLDSANTAMMNWMDAFRVDFKGKDHTETMQYLKQQYDKIKAIDSMNTIAEGMAKSLLNEKMKR